MSSNDANSGAHSAVSSTRGGAAIAEMPERIGPYRVKTLLGAGGMGIVYLVENEALGRDEALKVPRFEAGDEVAGRERFLREARAAAGSEHPNLCPVLHAGVADGVCFLTMRYLEGVALSRHRGAAFPPRQAVELVLTLARALEYAHSRDVLHRDLKPSNVMLCEGVGPVVMDFGLAKRFVNPDEKLTHSGSLLGTPSYAPPEQLCGNLGRIGPWSDTYSLGVILFELLAGRPPFVGTAAEVIGKVQFAPAPQPSEFVPGLLPALDEVCLRALEKQPEGRYESMTAFAAALEGCLGELPATPVPSRAAGAVPMAGLAGVAEAGSAFQTVKDSRRGDGRPTGVARAALACAGGLVGVGLIALACALVWGPLARTTPDVLKTDAADSDERLANAEAERQRLAKESRDLAELAEKRRVELTEADGQLRQAMAEQSRLSAQVEKQRRELADAAERLKSAEDGDKTKLVESQRARLEKEVAKQGVEFAATVEKLKLAEAERSRLEKDSEKLRLAEGEKLKAAEAEKQRLEKEVVKQGGDLAATVEKLKSAEAEKQRLEKEGEKLRLAEAEKLKLTEAEKQRLEKEVARQSRDLTETVEKLKVAQTERARFEKEAEKRLAEATELYGQGMDAMTGQGKAFDEEKAFTLFQLADAKGHPFSRARVGKMSIEGRGTDKDEKEGLRLIQDARPGLEKAVEREEPDARILLGALLADGQGIPKDEKKAVELFRKAADKGHPGAMNSLGLMYERGRGVPKDGKKAVELYQMAADKGNPVAMTLLGLAYADGRSVPKDEKKAVELLQKAADKGNPVAMNNLGTMYAYGHGVPKDEKKAVELLQKAADKGYPGAMFSLGAMYEDGHGVPKDEKKAVELYQKAADKGHPLAMTNLGAIYAAGQGVPKDEKKAVELFRKAADKGLSGAMNNLGTMYERGRGVEKDEKKAVELYQMAADKGEPAAMSNLGNMYENGRGGVTRNAKTALMWYRRAAALGNEVARQNAARLEAKE